MANDYIGCTKCNFEGVIQYRPLNLIYRLPDGSTVLSGRTFGWCASCKKIRDIEARIDATQIRAEIEELKSRQRPISVRIGNVLDKLLGGRGNEVPSRVEELTRLLSLAEPRKSKPRCLACGTEGAQIIAFDEQGLSVDFVHECGGRLRKEPPDPAAIRFNYTPETIYLDQEGRRLAS